MEEFEEPTEEQIEEIGRLQLESLLAELTEEQIEALRRLQFKFFVSANKAAIVAVCVVANAYLHNIVIDGVTTNYAGDLVYDETGAIADVEPLNIDGLYMIPIYHKYLQEFIVLGYVQESWLEEYSEGAEVWALKSI